MLQLSRSLVTVVLIVLAVMSLKATNSARLEEANWREMEAPKRNAVVHSDYEWGERANPEAVHELRYRVEMLPISV